jgi:hypothetical protein
MSSEAIQAEIDADWAQLDHIERVNQFAYMSPGERASVNGDRDRQHSLDILLTDLSTKVEHSRHGGQTVFICPIGNTDAHIDPDPGEVWCECGDGSHAEADVEWALRYQAQALPRRCTESVDTYGHLQNCQMHQRWSEAMRKVTHTISERFTSKLGGSCDHSPQCPSELHHQRLDYREADTWAISVVEGLADDGARFKETALADAPELSPARYLDLGDNGKVIRPGDLVYLHGMNGAGKSPTIDLLGIEHLCIDPDTLWILFDYELGKRRQLERLINAGLTKNQIRESIYYVEFPSLLTDRAKEVLVRGVLDKAERYGKVPRLMTWDTFSRSCSQMPGADPERNGHINAWFTSHPDWAKTTFEEVTSSPLTQYITDHPNKDDDDMPGGGHAKQDRVAINLWLKRGTAFATHHTNGRSDFVVAKHAHGDYTREMIIASLRNRIDLDDASRFYIDPAPPADPDQMNVDLGKAGTDPDDKIEAAIIKKLRKAGKRGLTRSEVTGGGGSSAAYRRVLDRMVDEKMVVERPIPKTSTGKRYWLPAYAPLD